jgi:exodeoxyribonuclease V alpha subunit
LQGNEKLAGITLTDEQRKAVLTSATSNISMILGGAGTGKTTALAALYATLEEVQPGLPIFQLALAGRAAKRISEATGRDAITIAGFLLKEEIPGGCSVVIDEMSMVDIILMYRLLKKIPQTARIVLVGDPSQLPPIGPGLVLHTLAGNPSIPQVELKTVKRQTKASGIPAVAEAIRYQRKPMWARYEGFGSGVSFVE